MRRLCWIFATSALLAASPVCAQQMTPPRLEIGGSLSGVLPILSGDGPVVVVGAGPRVATNITRSLAVEAFGEVVGPTEASGTLALYVLQLKYAMRRSADGKGTLSVTAGAAGSASYQHWNERRLARLDGSTVVYPEYRRFRATAPNTVGVGIVHERVLGRRASSRFDLQGYAGGIGGFALRAAAGLSFGIGGSR
jgi:hypothetical protein